MTEQVESDVRLKVCEVTEEGEGHVTIQVRDHPLQRQPKDQRSRKEKVSLRFRAQVSCCQPRQPQTARVCMTHLGEVVFSHFGRASRGGRGGRRGGGGEGGPVSKLGGELVLDTLEKRRRTHPDQTGPRPRTSWR